MGSAKDLVENRIVADFIEERLRGLQQVLGAIGLMNLDMMEGELLDDEEDDFDANATAATVARARDDVGEDDDVLKVTTGELELLRPQQVQHIIRHITTTLPLLDMESSSSSSGALLLRALNPTPAVCGRGQQEALAAIRRLEGKGWTAAGTPVPWGPSPPTAAPSSASPSAPPSNSAAATAAAAAVPVVDGSDGDDDEGEGGGGGGTARPAVESSSSSSSSSSSVIRVYAGAGIVEGSDPFAEWVETETKMRPFMTKMNFDALKGAPLDEASAVMAASNPSEIRSSGSSSSSSSCGGGGGGDGGSTGSASRSNSQNRTGSTRW